MCAGRDWDWGQTQPRLDLNVRTLGSINDRTVSQVLPSSWSLTPTISPFASTSFCASAPFPSPWLLPPSFPSSASGHTSLRGPAFLSAILIWSTPPPSSLIRPRFRSGPFADFSCLLQLLMIKRRPLTSLVSTCSPFPRLQVRSPHVSDGEEGNRSATELLGESSVAAGYESCFVLPDESKSFTAHDTDTDEPWSTLIGEASFDNSVHQSFHVHFEDEDHPCSSLALGDTETMLETNSVKCIGLPLATYRAIKALRAKERAPRFMPIDIEVQYADFFSNVPTCYEKERTWDAPST